MNYCVFFQPILLDEKAFGGPNNLILTIDVKQIHFHLLWGDQISVKKMSYVRKIHFKVQKMYENLKTYCQKWCDWSLEPQITLRH